MYMYMCVRVCTCVYARAYACVCVVWNFPYFFGPKLGYSSLEIEKRYAVIMGR